MSTFGLPEAEQAPVTVNDSGLLQRLMRNVKIPLGQLESTGCWEYQKGSREDRGGYCNVNVRPAGAKERKTKKFQVHRLILILYGVELQAEQQVDHTCGNTKCCNPDHLHAVTQQENLKRQRERLAADGYY